MASVTKPGTTRSAPAMSRHTPSATSFVGVRWATSCSLKRAQTLVPARLTSQHPKIEIRMTMPRALRKPIALDTWMNTYSSMMGTTTSSTSSKATAEAYWRPGSVRLSNPSGRVGW